MKLDSPAPVIVFAYCRHWHLEQTLKALSQADGASESELWVFSDGAASSERTAEVLQVRELLHDQRWHKPFKKVHVIESDQNKGLATSIVTGVSRVLDEADRAIILEDDLIVSRDFLTFMNSALEFYENTREVGSVTAYSPIKRAPNDYAHDVMLVPRSCSHGWATWRNRWKSVDWSGAGAERIWQDKPLRRSFAAAGSDKIDRLRRRLEGKSKTWSILFNLWQTLDDRMTIYPVHNRVQNIGYDGSGENSGINQSMHTEIERTQ
ncbi:MAG: glycosyltransferase, partial [Pseudomonadota bacterium]